MEVFHKGQFFGETIRACQTNEISLTQTHYDGALELPLHAHQRPYFAFILSGTFLEYCDRRSHVRTPGSIIFRPAGEVHRQTFASGQVRLFRTELGSRYFQELDKINVPVDHSNNFIHAQDMLTTVRKLYREFQTENDSSSQLILEGLVLELIGSFARYSSLLTPRNKPIPPWLLRVCDLIEERYTEPITLQMLAREAGVHPVTLAREHRRHFKHPVGYVIRQKRIEFATRQIIDGNRSLAEIAVAAGFYDQTHFTKIFRAFIGTTPKRFQSIQLRINNLPKS